MAELMYVLSWFAGAEPTFTPVMPPETYAGAITKAKQIVAPLTEMGQCGPRAHLRAGRFQKTRQPVTAGIARRLARTAKLPSAGAEAGVPSVELRAVRLRGR